MILGYLFAVLGALGSGVGSVLESLGVKRSGAYGGDNDDLGKIAQQPLYWTGVTIDVAAFVCAAIALHRLPLFLVQSVMAFSVGVTAVVSVLLGIRLGRRGWMALGVAVVGLILLGVSAQTGPAKALPPGWRWILLATAIPVAAIGYFGNRTNRRWTVSLLAFGAGLGFTVVAISARTLHLSPPWSSVFTEPGAWAIAANGVIATAVFAMALQKGSATTASAVMFSTNTVLPSAIGLILLHDSIRSGYVLPGVLGFLLAVSGAVALAHFSELAERRREREAEPSEVLDAA